MLYSNKILVTDVKNSENLLLVGLSVKLSTVDVNLDTFLRSNLRQLPRKTIKFAIISVIELIFKYHFCFNFRNSRRRTRNLG